MKNIILPIYAVVIALLVVSCGPSIPKVDKKLAKKTCSCYKNYAKLSSDQAKLKSKNWDKIVWDSGKEFDAEEYEAFEKTEEFKEYDQTRFDLRDAFTTDSTCLVNWAKEQGKEYETKAKQDFPDYYGLIEDICPEVAYLYGIADKAEHGEKRSNSSLII